MCIMHNGRGWLSKLSQKKKTHLLFLNALNFGTLAPVNANPGDLCWWCLDCPRMQEKGLVVVGARGGGLDRLLNVTKKSWLAESYSYAKKTCPCLHAVVSLIQVRLRKAPITWWNWQISWMHVRPFPNSSAHLEKKGSSTDGRPIFISLRRRRRRASPPPSFLLQLFPPFTLPYTFLFLSGLFFFFPDPSSKISQASEGGGRRRRRWHRFPAYKKGVEKTDKKEEQKKKRRWRTNLDEEGKGEKNKRRLKFRPCRKRIGLLLSRSNVVYLILTGSQKERGRRRVQKEEEEKVRNGVIAPPPLLPSSKEGTRGKYCTVMRISWGGQSDALFVSPNVHLRTMIEGVRRRGTWSITLLLLTAPSRVEGKPVSNSKSGTKGWRPPVHPSPLSPR